MALCMAASILKKDGFDPADQMARYLKCWKEGYLSATGACFDIGNTVRAAQAKYAATREPYCGSSDPHTAGNGALMRLAPAVLYAHGDDKKLLSCAADSAPIAMGKDKSISFLSGRKRSEYSSPQHPKKSHQW